MKAANVFHKTSLGFCPLTFDACDGKNNAWIWLAGWCWDQMIVYYHASLQQSKPPFTKSTVWKGDHHEKLHSFEGRFEQNNLSVRPVTAIHFQSHLTIQNIEKYISIPFPYRLLGIVSLFHQGFERAEPNKTYVWRLKVFAWAVAMAMIEFFWNELKVSHLIMLLFVNWSNAHPWAAILFWPPELKLLSLPC